MAKGAAAQKKSEDTAQTMNSVQRMQAAQRGPEIHVVNGDAKPEDKPKELPDYPEGTKLFSYTPKSGGKPIQMPMEFDRPNKVWLWELSQQPFLVQTWQWMDRANVPKQVQRRAVELPDDEYTDMFNEWFKAMGGGATPGE